MTLHRLLLPLMLLGCAPSTTATLGGESSSEDLADTTDETSSDTDTDPDDTSEPEEEYVFPYSGDYTGVMDVIASSSWGDFDVGDCEIVADVDDAGEMAGTAECVLDIGGWGGDEAYTYEMTGFVDEDGAVEGEMPLSFGDGNEYIMTVAGTADEDGMMNLDFAVAFEQGGGDFQLLGEAELVRDN